MCSFAQEKIRMFYTVRDAHHHVSLDDHYACRLLNHVPIRTHHLPQMAALLLTLHTPEPDTCTKTHLPKIPYSLPTKHTPTNRSKTPLDHTFTEQT